MMVFLMLPAGRMGAGTEGIGFLTVREPFHIVYVLVAAGRELGTMKQDLLIFRMGQLVGFL